MAVGVVGFVHFSAICNDLFRVDYRAVHIQTMPSPMCFRLARDSFVGTM